MNNRGEVGAVLPVALIMLLILTVIGVAGMQDTSLQERMAGNMRDRNLAFQASESALRAGEKYLESAVLPAFNNTGGLLNKSYPNIRAGNPDFWEAYPWGENSREYGANFAELSAPPRYVIEEVPVVTAPVGESAKFGTLKELRSYRITSKGVGGTTDAVVILQSTYRRQGD